MKPQPLPRTKIVCTLGPSTDASDILDALIAAGMSVARINMSHGSHAEHASRIAQVREAAARAGATVAILGDLQGPKLRIGDVLPGFALRAGESIVLATEAASAGVRSVPLPHPELVAACRERGIAAERLYGCRELAL